MGLKFIGIDLAALEKNPTGTAIYDGKGFECSTLHTDGELLALAVGHRPSVIAIDAPLSLPYGRCCFNDDCCGPRKMRVCDRMMISMGYRVFPPGFSYMKQLTLRGIALKKELEARGFKVIEAHPRTSMRILGIESFEEAKSEHESDACAAALTAWLYEKGKCIDLTGPDGTTVIPARDPEAFIRLRGP
jgi:uncharacterized protein